MDNLSGLAIAAFVFLFQVMGVLTAVHAVMSTRTSQGAIAWAVSAITFPYITVPAYWVFGKSKFDGYDKLVKSRHYQMDDSEAQARQALVDRGLLFEPRNEIEASHLQILERLSRLPITIGNSAKLLIDGQETFAAIQSAIAQAEDYILFQFYIVRDDELGRTLKDALIERARAGVRVYFLYDEVGSSPLRRSRYLTDLQQAGVQVYPFHTTKGSGNRFRLNFRNHRKIVVVDGKVALVGGLNVGDEYLGKHPTLSPWRDTHVQVHGPVVQCVQAPFVEDWNWASESSIRLNWDPHPAEDGQVAAACIPTGPADDLETGTLWFLHAINSAMQRLWIVSPYFVPDEQLMSGLQSAALRGVDVRILIPQKPDHWMVYLSGISYLEEAEAAGIRMFRYQPGFLHQKVMLIDDHVSAIGTSNLDNRSMRLNFEVTMLLVDREFATQVETMLEKDFANSKEVFPSEYTERWLPFRFLVRLCRLAAPVQ